MSIQWADNFGSYGTGSPSATLMANGLPYTQLDGGGVVADPLVSGGVCWNISSGDGLGYQRSIVPTPVNALGIALRWNSSGGGLRTPFGWTDNSSQGLYSLNVEINGAISIYQNGYNFGQNLGTRVATTTIPVITYNSWWHIEAMLDYALGNITVYVEGVRVLTYSFTAAPSTLIYNMVYSVTSYGSAYGGSAYIKDFVMYDKSGTVNNTVGSIGPCTVYRLALDSDVSNGWSITGGTTVNGTIGGEPPADSTSYITAGVSPIPAPAVCGISHLPSNIVGVRGIVSLQRVAKSDGGDAEYQVDIVSGSSTHTGTAHTLSTSFNYQYDVVELDPATGDLWSPIAVNNLNIEINRTV
jgi:hypothetical protein